MLIDKQLLSYLRYVHGSYNLLVAVLFFLQGFLGLKIRKARREGLEMPAPIIKRHRTMGPILFIFGIMGFFAGLVLVYFNHGNILQYPLHLLFGVLITVFLTNLFIVSRMIKGVESHWRDMHYFIGIIILCFYLVQSFLGLGILL